MGRRTCWVAPNMGLGWAVAHAWCHIHAAPQPGQANLAGQFPTSSITSHLFFHSLPQGQGHLGKAASSSSLRPVKIARHLPPGNCERDVLVQRHFALAHPWCRSPERFPGRRPGNPERDTPARRHFTLVCPWRRLTEHFPGRHPGLSKGFASAKTLCPGTFFWVVLWYWAVGGLLLDYMGAGPLAPPMVPLWEDDIQLHSLFSGW